MLMIEEFEKHNVKPFVDAGRGLCLYCEEDKRIAEHYVAILNRQPKLKKKLIDELYKQKNEDITDYLDERTAIMMGGYPATVELKEEMIEKAKSVLLLREVEARKYKYILHPNKTP